MAFVKSLSGEIHVSEGIHSFVVGNVPLQIPDALVDKAVAQGCQLVEGENASTNVVHRKPRTRLKQNDRHSDA